MTEVYNNLMKNIDLAVDEKYLKRVNPVTPGFENRTTVEVLQYLFNTLGWETLVDKDISYEKTRKAYERSTSIDWIFV